MAYIAAKVRAKFPLAGRVDWAAQSFNHPSLKEAVELQAQQGIKRVLIMPFFLFDGKHSKEDIPESIERLKTCYPDIEFSLTSILGTDTLLADLVIKRIQEASLETRDAGGIPDLPATPEAIEACSMEIIESLLPPIVCSAGELQVIKRIVHAAGDIEIAQLVRFHPQAIASGIKAIRTGNPIYTDVKMAAAGINRKKTDEFGCDVTCAIDNPGAIKITNEGGITRSAAAIRFLDTKLHNAIIAIGNAPTALFALIDLIDSTDITPALIVGMPVGFVGAKESKSELMKRDIPFIAIEGNRGGSALAVAAVNALLKLS